MIVIDGSEGEGGGQVLRTALGLSIVTGQPFRIERIRAGRQRPGLMRQHVTAVEAACAIGGAECGELAVGAAEIAFFPRTIVPGDHEFAVGTAGSATLVLQTVLPALLRSDRPSRLVLSGGTHNPSAPPFEFLDRTFLPLLRRMGAEVEARLDRPGFYPAGGGRMTVEIRPASKLDRLDLLDRGSLRRTEARVLIAALPREIAVRELATMSEVLGWPEEAQGIDELPERVGPGNVLLLEAAFDHVTEIVAGFGRIGVSAERVAEQAGKRMRGFLESNAAVGPYLADQLLLPLALAGGGSFTTVKPSLHCRTAAAVIGRFLGVGIDFSERDDGCHLVTVRSG